MSGEPRFFIVELDTPHTCTETINDRQVSADTYLSHYCAAPTRRGYRDPSGKVRPRCATHMHSSAVLELDSPRLCTADTRDPADRARGYTWYKPCLAPTFYAVPTGQDNSPRCRAHLPKEAHP